ncbi:hypothetical protein KGF54_000008 [Candida jiufengensis]|uniref:uncharacterized protein n=1 Tax=Candida jiufengensis TaxID=497108 RepID=UPI00222540D0|nr:uncharacterized protein KGF54_000008 [Candida jiufengensis]KAI5957080.1 hypothetical protein KGF54_000008 [Candida jiufengensis]
MQFLVEFCKSHWKAIATAFTIGKFLWESYINNRQLKKIQITQIGLRQNNFDLLSNDKFKQSLFGLENLVKLTINKLGFDLIENLLIIHFDVYSILLELSKKINESLSFILPSNSYFQTIIFSIISNILIFCWGVPIQFYGKFIVSDFNQNESPLEWFMIQINLLVFKIFGDSIKIFGSSILINLVKNFPILQISIGFLIYSILRISLSPLFISVISGPNFLKHVPQSDLKDEILKLCSKIGYDCNSIYIADSAISSMGFNYLPNMVTINEGSIKSFTTKELTSIILQCILQIKLNLHLEKQFINSIILYLELFFFEKILYKDNNVLKQFGFEVNEESNLIFIKYLIFNKIFIPFDIIIPMIKNYLIRRKIHQVDQSTYELYQHEFVTAMNKMNGNNPLKNFENDSIYGLYYSGFPNLNRRIEFLKENH